MEAEAATLRVWAQVAKPGAQRVYFIGVLGNARTPLLARTAMELQETGAVNLVQKRIAEDIFAYIAQRR